MRSGRSWNLLYAATLALPAVLLYSSVRTFREMDAQRDVYLRERAASIAGSLDAASTQNGAVETAIQSLLDEEPHLRDLRITVKSDAQADPNLDAVWKGWELFHTQYVGEGRARVYRAYVPIHAQGEMQVARIDLDPAAADFLLIHARHNVIISLAGGVVLVLISVYSIWAARHTAALERRQLEMEHLARLGTMSAVLAHEIRNPLGTIKGFAQLALEQGGSSMGPLLTPVVEQTDRLEALVNDLLVYGRPPSPCVQPVRWPDVAERIVAHGARLAGSGEAQLSVASSDIEFETDPNLLEHILVNLVRNALDAVQSVPGGRVDVTAARNDDHVELTVQDNGPGIQASDLVKVREPFFTTKAFGTGLGLPISVRLTEALRGTLDIRTAAPHGTVVTVRLPVRG